MVDLDQQTIALWHRSYGMKKLLLSMEVNAIQRVMEDMELIFSIMMVKHI